MNAKVDISGFNAGLAGFTDQLGIEAATVLRKEIGELIKTLVRVTPAADSEKVKSNISGKFEQLSQAAESHAGGKVGKGGVNWYYFDSERVFGVAPEKDMTDASVEELNKLSYQVTEGGRLRLPNLRSPGSRQTFYLTQRILSKASTVKRLIAKRITHKGRLKAGWLAAAQGGAISLSGSNMPPAFVTRHASGCRGYFIDGLGVKNFPAFTIANFAAGIGNQKLKVNWFVQQALDIRVKAMATNLGMFMRGKKPLSSYAGA